MDNAKLCHYRAYIVQCQTFTLIDNAASLSHRPRIKWRDLKRDLRLAIGDWDIAAISNLQKWRGCPTRRLDRIHNQPAGNRDNLEGIVEPNFQCVPAIPGASSSYATQSSEARSRIHARLNTPDLIGEESPSRSEAAHWRGFGESI